MSRRQSPARSATLMPGKTVRGLNGRLWRSIADVNGRFTWRPVKGQRAKRRSPKRHSPKRRSASPKRRSPKRRSSKASPRKASARKASPRKPSARKASPRIHGGYGGYGGARRKPPPQRFVAAHQQRRAANAAALRAGKRWRARAAGRAAAAKHRAGGVGTTRSPSRAVLDQQLYRAAEAGNYAEVTRLVQEGASPDAKNEHGVPAVVAAAAKGDTYAVQTLLEARPRGCDPNVPDDEGTALMHAAEGGYIDTVRLLLGHLGSMRAGVQIRIQVDLDAVDKEGMTALMWAAEAGEWRVAALLIEAEADVNLRDLEGKTALDIAAAFAAERAHVPGVTGWDKIVEMLQAKQNR